MDFPFSSPGFETKTLAVRICGVFNGPALLADGVEQRPLERAVYSITDDSGQKRRIVLKPTLFDAVPAVQVDEQTARAIVPKLAWFEYAWLGIPFALIAVGGGLGGLFGALGLAANTRIFRTRHGVLPRYGLTALVSLGMVLAYLLGATIVQLAIHGAG